jgi:hypothetical protein
MSFAASSSAVPGDGLIPIKQPRALAGLAAKPPALFLPDERAGERFFGFFTAHIRNRNTRRAYYKAACRFSDWCEGRGVFDLAQVKPPHVAAYVEMLGLPEPQGAGLSKPSVKQHLAALRMLFDWLVVGHVLDHNPAHAVRGPKYSQKKGKTPVLDREEARARRLDRSRSGAPKTGTTHTPRWRARRHSLRTISEARAAGVMTRTMYSTERSASSIWSHQSLPPSMLVRSCHSEKPASISRSRKPRANSSPSRRA